MSAPVKDTAYVDRLMVQAFAGGRPVRSEQYRQGVRSILLHRLTGSAKATMPYVLGTCEADAYFAGQNEGHTIVRIEIGGEF